MDLLTLTIYVLFFLVFLASALKCWRCSSDASGAAFCQDPFEPDLVSEQQKRWSYVDCSFPPQAQLPYGSSGNTRPVCKKMKQVSKYSTLKIIIDNHNNY